MTKRKQSNQTWRYLEYRMFIPRRQWKTEEAQRFADFCADCFGAVRKPLVFDIKSRNDRNRLLGMFCSDKIRLSLETDSDQRWRVLIHELAHYWADGHGELFGEAMQMIHKMFRAWHRENK